jgi:hypothetical protein
MALELSKIAQSPWKHDLKNIGLLVYEIGSTWVTSACFTEIMDKMDSISVVHEIKVNVSSKCYIVL